MWYTQLRSTCTLSGFQLLVVQYLEDGWGEIAEKNNQLVMEPPIWKFTDIL